MFSLEEKVAVITGGGKGIGRAISETFAAQGAIAEIFELDPAAGEETAAAITEAGGTAQATVSDVSNQAAVNAAIEAIVQRRGKIDILVNNAGIAHIGTALNTTEEDFERIFRVNVKGVYNCIQAVLPHMIEAGGGVILNMASIASITGIADRFAYSTSKGAVLTMTYSIATDFIKNGIRCNAICPARVHTPFVDGYLDKHFPDNRDEMFEKLSKVQPIGRMAKPEEIAHLALYLCSDEAAYLTGVAYPIDGGFMNVR